MKYHLNGESVKEATCIVITEGNFPTIILNGEISDEGDDRQFNQAIIQLIGWTKPDHEMFAGGSMTLYDPERESDNVRDSNLIGILAVPEAYPTPITLGIHVEFTPVA